MDKGLSEVYGNAHPWYESYEKSKTVEWNATPLGDDEKQPFTDWLTKSDLFKSIKQQVASENGIPLDKIEDKKLVEGMLRSGDYDYVGAWKDNVQSTVSKHDGKPHWPSRSSDGKMLKSPQHKTAWKEYFMDAYGYDPDELGLHEYEQARQYQGPLNIGSRRWNKD